MERTYHIVNVDGLQIPLPFIERYGLRPGAGAVVELGESEIRIVSAAPSREDIQNRALRLLLHRLGDAVTVNSRLVEEGAERRWDVSIGAQGTEAILGMLQYSAVGVLLTDLESEIPRIIRNASKLAFQK